MPEKLSTGFEEPALTAIKCDFCNDTGSVPKKTHKSPSSDIIVDEWEDCKVCIFKRIETKTNVRNIR